MINITSNVHFRASIHNKTETKSDNKFQEYHLTTAEKISLYTSYKIRKKMIETYIIWYKQKCRISTNYLLMRPLVLHILRNCLKLCNDIGCFSGCCFWWFGWHYSIYRTWWGDGCVAHLCQISFIFNSIILKFWFLAIIDFI